MRRPRAGFTLMELMLTMSLAFLVMSIGAGVYLSMRRDLVIQGEASKLAAAISTTRNSAVTRRAPAILNVSVVSPIDGDLLSGDVTFYAIVREPVVTWHFEQVLGDAASFYVEGSRGCKAFVRNDASLSTDGRVGSALYLSPAAAEPPYLEVEDLAPLNMRDGVYIEAWIHPDATRLVADAVLPIVSKWDEAGSFSAYTLYLECPEPEKGFSLCGSVTTAGAAGQTTLRKTSLSRIRPGQWTHVAMSYAQQADEDRELKVFIDGVEDTSGPQENSLELIAVSSGPVRIGRIHPAGEEVFAGLIDEVTIATYSSGERQKLAGRLGFAIENLDRDFEEEVGGKRYTNYRLVYNRNGRLDVPAGASPTILLYSPVSQIKRNVRSLAPTVLGGVEPDEWEERFGVDERGEWKWTRWD